MSNELGGFGHYGGSVTAFMKPESEKAASLGEAPGALPCDEAGSQAALQAAQAEMMINAAMSGKAPSLRRGGSAVPTAEQMEAALSGKGPLPAPARPAHPLHHIAHGSGPQRFDQGRDRPRPHPFVRGDSDSSPSPSPLSSLPKRGPAAKAASSSSSTTLQSPFANPTPPFHEQQRRRQREADSRQTLSPEELEARRKEAEDYYRAVPRNELSKDEMWQRINKASTERAEREGSATVLTAGDVDYYRIEEDLKEQDLLHYRIGELAYEDQRVRRYYYAMWSLAMALNKARWTMLEVQSQRGAKSTGAGMKLLFWKESVNSLLDSAGKTTSQFTDSHPILRPFGAVVEGNPHLTKAFVRGFTSARLKVIQQPGNVKQLFDHFDKYYGYFFNSLLEVTGVKDENAEHMMQHIGRAIGLTNHCVMFWKKYARIGFTMLPADLCADNHVNLALLKNISLASKDRAVKKLLYDVMCITKDEMLHARKIAPNVDPKAWPIAMECFYANYYLGFLQRRQFNVSAMFADYNIENAGFTWYRVKKRWEWERYQSLERLLDEAAPLPLINTSISHRGSLYKMATGVGRQGTPTPAGKA